MKARLLTILCALLMSAGIQAHDLEPLHVDGRYLKNLKGDIVTLHGFMTNFDSYFTASEYSWEGFDVETCLKNKKAALDALLESGWKMDYVRVLLNGGWCHEKTNGDDFKTFRFELFKKYFDELYLPMIDYYHEKGIYTLLYPPLTTPEMIELGDLFQEHLLMVWDYVSNHPRIRNNPGVMFELANEPVFFNCRQGESYKGWDNYITNSSSVFREVRDYFQPLVDYIRSHCDNIIYVPGLHWQSDYDGFADYPIRGDNIGYAIHCYPGVGDLHEDWEKHKFPIGYMAPVIITENAWYDGNFYLDGEHGTTSEFGKPLKSVIDELGNVSWNCYEPAEDYYYLVNSSSSSEKALISNNPEACFLPMYQWWNKYANTKVMSVNQLKAKSVSFEEFPTTVAIGQKQLARIKAEFTNGMTWDVSGDAEYTIAEERVLRIKNGVIWALEDGTTDVTVKYTDGAGQTFSRKIKVSTSFFPLTAEGFNPNLQLEGSFDEATGTFSSSSACVGGWSFADGLDLSAYKKLVVQLNQKQDCWAMVRIWDDSNVWSETEAWNDDKGDIGFDFNDATEVVIDLQSLHKQNGEPMDLSHIHHVGIWINGVLGSVSIKRVFLSNDGTTPAYREPIRVYADNKVMYRGDEMPALTFSTSGPAINGTPKLSTTANSSSVGSFPITVERGSITDEDVTYIDGMLTILERPKASLDEFESAATAVRNMKIGWNLWNTLEAEADPEENEWFHPTGWQDWETCWGNAVTKPELMKMMRKAGINAIRVPVTWFRHMDANDQVDPEWMKRVHDVVDYVIDQGMYCILNTHGDGIWIKAESDSYNQYRGRFEKLWKQIAEEFKDYDEHLVFEGYNEISDKDHSWFTPAKDYGEEHVQQSYKALNDFAQSFVNAVRSTGGNNKERNLLVNIYTACTGPEEGWHTEALEQMKKPEDVTNNHIIFGIHDYWMESKDDVDAVLGNVTKYFASKGIPTIIGEWGAYNEGDNHYEDLHGYFLEQTKTLGIAPFLWGGMSGGNMRSYPAFEKPEEARAVLKAYYDDDYEPTLLTADDYELQGVKVSFDYQWAELTLYDGEIYLNEYNGIRVELEKVDGIVVKVYGESDGKEQYCGMSSTSETFTFDKSSLGNKVTGITLQNGKEGENEAKLLHAYLIKKDGTEERIDINHYSVYHGCDYEMIMSRKRFVHTVEYDYQWAELNIFYDDIALKLKNYKGIRLELAEMPTNVHVKVYGDGGQKEDYISFADASSTILFNTDIFSREINRVTLQYTKEGKGEAKVISAWLIRQDGTEEYSDLSSLYGCEITKVEKYVPEPPITFTAVDLTMTYGDEVPELTFTTEGGTPKGTPTLTTTATKTSPVGTYPIKVERGTVANTQATFVDGTLTITQAPLTVGVQDVTITEGDAIPTFTLTYDGWRNNDKESTAFTKKPTAKTSATNKSKAGTYTITVSGGEAKNYKLSYQSGTLTIKEKEAPSPWMSLVLNSDLEGNDVSGFYKREDAAKNNKIVPATIVEGTGKNNSRGIVIHSTDNPPENWNTQLFIRLTQSLPAGTKYRMSLDYKASQNADVPMECHAEPGDYIHWDFGSLSFTKSWKHYEKEGTITAEQSTAEKKMHAIAFNLANVATATTYYFDNIVFEIDQTTDIRDMNADNQRRTVIYNLGGQRLSEPHKGINIIDGKKVFMK